MKQLDCIVKCMKSAGKSHNPEKSQLRYFLFFVKWDTLSVSHRIFTSTNYGVHQIIAIPGNLSVLNYLDIPLY